MTWDSVIGFMSLAGALMASYAKLQSDITRLKTEVRMLRDREQDVQRYMEELKNSLHRIEKALVKAGLIEID